MKKKSNEIIKDESEEKVGLNFYQEIKEKSSKIDSRYKSSLKASLLSKSCLITVFIIILIGIIILLIFLGIQR